MDCGRAEDSTVSRPSGVTLVELLVVLALLGVMAGVVGLAWQPGHWLGRDGTANSEPITRVRLRALESGRVITAVVTLGGRAVPVIAFPDGRLLGAEQLGVNPLTGEADAQTTAQ